MPCLTGSEVEQHKEGGLTRMQDLGNSVYLDMMQIPEQFNVSIFDKFVVTTINNQNLGARQFTTRLLATPPKISEEFKGEMGNRFCAKPTNKQKHTVK